MQSHGGLNKNPGTHLTTSHRTHTHTRYFTIGYNCKKLVFHSYCCQVIITCRVYDSFRGNVLSRQRNWPRFGWIRSSPVKSRVQVFIVPVWINIAVYTPTVCLCLGVCSLLTMLTCWDLVFLHQCWMPGLKNQDWCGSPTFPTHPALCAFPKIEFCWKYSYIFGILILCRHWKQIFSYLPLQCTHAPVLC